MCFFELLVRLADWLPELLGTPFVLMNLYIIFCQQERSKFAATCAQCTSRVSLVWCRYRGLCQRRHLAQRPAVPDQDPVMLELRKLSQDSPGSSRSVLQLVRDLGDAGCLKVKHSTAAFTHLAENNDLQGALGVLLLSLKAGLPLTNAMITDSLKLLNAREEGAMSAVVLGRMLLNEYRGMYYLDEESFDLLVTSAARLWLHADVELFFARRRELSRPSTRLFALVIQSFGSHGAVNAALNAYDDLRDGHEKDYALAWNSLLTVLARNGCTHRAAAVLREGTALGMRALRSVEDALVQVDPEQFKDLVRMPPTLKTSRPRTEMRWRRDGACRSNHW